MAEAAPVAQIAPIPASQLSDEEKAKRRKDIEEKVAAARLERKIAEEQKVIHLIHSR